jgi:hypothetical protein
VRTEKFEIKLMSEDSAAIRIEAYEKVLIFLLKKYYEGCEGIDCSGVFKSVNGGTSRERILNEGAED